MAKVYVLTQGQYSDHDVVGVFSSEQKASDVQAMMEEVNKDCYFINEYEIDELVAHRVVSVWTAYIRMEDGHVDIQGLPRQRFRHPTATEIEIGPIWSIVRSPISEEHAIKVATEARQEWLRTREIEGREPVQATEMGE